MTRFGGWVSWDNYGYISLIRYGNALAVALKSRLKTPRGKTVSLPARSFERRYGDKISGAYALTYLSSEPAETTATTEWDGFRVRFCAVGCTQIDTLGNELNKEGTRLQG